MDACFLGRQSHRALFFPKILHQTIPSKHAKKFTFIIALQNFTKKLRFGDYSDFCHDFYWFLLFRRESHFSQKSKNVWECIVLQSQYVIKLKYLAG